MGARKRRPNGPIEAVNKLKYNDYYYYSLLSHTIFSSQFVHECLNRQKDIRSATGVVAQCMGGTFVIIVFFFCVCVCVSVPFVLLEKRAKVDGACFDGAFCISGVVSLAVPMWEGVCEMLLLWKSSFVGRRMRTFVSFSASVIPRRSVGMLLRRVGLHTVHSPHVHASALCCAVSLAFHSRFTRVLCDA